MGQRATVIDIIRHGEPVGGVLIRGQRNDPLSETGWEQMRSAVRNAAPWRRIVTSPLLRCAEFAQELGERLAIPVSEAEGIAEIGFGEWEGLPPAQLLAEQPRAYHSFWENPGENTPPGGEPLHLFQERVVAAFEAIIEERQGEHLLVVCHGGVIRMMVSHVLGMPPANLFRLDVPFASVSRIRVEGKIPRLNFLCGRF